MVFVSGATEANNLAIRGISAHLAAKGRPRILVGAGEHPSVLAAADGVTGKRVDRVPLLPDGSLNAMALDRMLDGTTGLVSVAAANHETGSVQAITSIAGRVASAGALLHSDLAQAAGKIPVDIGVVDLASVSAHKLGGPMGIGALVVRRRLRRHLAPLMLGGGQEGGLRAGTLPPALCVAFGVACRIAREEMAAEGRRVAALRDGLQGRLATAGGMSVNGGGERLPGNLNVSFEGVDGEALVMRVRDTVALSTGSACTSTSLEPSHVLEAIGVTGRRAEAAIRIGLGRSTTAEETAAAADAILDAVTALRNTLRRVA